MLTLFLIFPLIFLTCYKKNSFVVFILIVLILAAIAGFRNPLDEYNDSHFYLMWFEAGEAYLENTEPAYALINFLAMRMGLGFQWVLIITSSISIAILAWASKRSGRNAIAVLMLYFLLTYYFYNFNAMRQMTGVSFLLLGYTFLNEEKVKPFLLCVVVACLFHMSCMVSVVCLLFYRKEITFHPILVITCVLASLLIGSLNLTYSLLNSMSSLFPEYSGHLDGGVISENSFTLSKFALSLFYIYIYTQIKLDDLYLKVVFVGIVLFNLMSFSVIAMRLAYAFTPAQALLFASPKLTSAKMKKTNIVLIHGYALFVYYYMLLNSIGLMSFKLCDGEYL